MLLGAGVVVAKGGGMIAHDAEYYILEVQNGDKWAAADQEVDQKLAEFREKTGLGQYME